MTVFTDHGYILHGRGYRESSSLLEVLTQHHGRVSMVAKAVRKNPRSALFQPYQELELSWRGHTELCTLTCCESIRHYQIPPGHLLSALYVNELLIKLLPRSESNEHVYHCYNQFVINASQAKNIQAALRGFEVELLAALGYGINCHHDVTALAIQTHEMYDYVVPHGASKVDPTSVAAGVRISGHCLHAIANRQYSDAVLLPEMKMLTQYIFYTVLEGKKIISREWRQRSMARRD